MQTRNFATKEQPITEKYNPCIPDSDQQWYAIMDNLNLDQDCLQHKPNMHNRNIHQQAQHAQLQKKSAR
jgi:hypothetical protein